MTAPFAAIDLGTNTARLLIGTVAPDGRIETLLHKSTISRLGGGFSRQSGLSVEARQRAITILGEFARDLAAHGVVAVRAVATSAVRDAANGQEFVADVKMKTGISLQILADSEEAHLNAQGVFAGLDSVGDLFIFDIGGGSTEYVLTRGTTLLFSMSLPLGVVRLTEGKGAVPRMDDKISRELATLRAIMRERQLLSGLADATLVGTAGTVTTLAAMQQKVCHEAHSTLHGSTVTRAVAQRLFQTLLTLSPRQRLTLPGLEKGREDLIVAGALITIKTMELFGFDQCTVCETGLLQGALLSLQTGSNFSSS